MMIVVIMISFEIKSTDVNKNDELWNNEKEDNKICKITKNEMSSPCNENGEHKNYQKNNRMNAI